MARQSEKKRVHKNYRQSPPKRMTAKGNSLKKATNTTDFLFEIGTEELPWQVIQPALNQLGQSFEQLFHESRITHGTIRPVGTPRRLAVIVEHLALRQSAARQEFLGPPKSVAFNASGQPTQAALGFAHTQGISVKDLEFRKTAKGEYLCAVKEEAGQPTGDILTELLPGMVEKLTFPRSMRWNATGARFARPIRWLVVILGTRVLDVMIAGVPSGNRSRGHRFLKGKSGVNVLIHSPKTYVGDLRRAGVWVDQSERTNILQQQLWSLAQSVKGRVYAEHEQELLKQAVYTVECPHALVGQFKPSYLELPQEVLITSMKEHQGFFSVVSGNGTLLPRFIAASNMKLPNMDLIRKGNERVLSARLADAQYFYREDRKRKLVDRLEQLKGVIFHQKLGTLYQKTERMVSLASVLAESCGLASEKETSQRAALLAKADLTTGMVGEFPTLQGIMGREYASHDGEADAVCRALGEQYLPRNPDDPIPSSLSGKLCSLTDRLDTLAAFFRAGMIPSGSEDPLGLRRQAFGVIRILIEGTLGVDLNPIIHHANQEIDRQGMGIMHVGVPTRASVEEENSLRDFLAERLRYYGRVQRKFREDVMEAVLAGGGDVSRFDVLDLYLKMEALQEITGQKDFEPLMIGFKRAHRLVEKEQWTNKFVDVNALEHTSEQALFHAVEQARIGISAAMERREYSTGLQALIALKPSIDEFFTGVLVNAPDPVIRANRLSLLSEVKDLFFQYADFSKIQVQGS